MKLTALQHLKTLHLPKSVWHGLISLGTVRLGMKVLSFLRLIVAARWLGAESLGQYGLALLFLSLSEVLTETGINTVLLRHPKELQTYLHTAWAVSILRGIGIAVGLFLAQNWLSTQYQAPLLSTLIPLVACIAVVRGFLNPAIVRYQQDLAFGKESLFRLSLQLLDVLFGWGVLLWWHHPAALLSGTVVAAFLELFGSFFLFADRPKFWLARVSILTSLYRETRFAVGNSALQYASEHGDDLLVGWLLGPTALGLYQTGYKLASTLTLDIGSLFGQVLYPVFGRWHREKKSLVPLWQGSGVALLVFHALFALPYLLFPALVVRATLGPDWLQIVPVIQLLFLAGFLKAFFNIWNPIHLLARTIHWFFATNLLQISLMFSGIVFLSLRWGVVGASMAVFLAIALTLPLAAVQTWFALKKLES